MTTTPARPTFTQDARGNYPCPHPACRPTFTQDARGNYPCPHPACRRTFTRPQGIGRHWTSTHHLDATPLPETAAPEPDQDDDVFSDEINDLHARLYGVNTNDDDDEPDDDQDDDAGEPANGAVTDSLITTPGPYLGLGPHHDCTCSIDVDTILALSDATVSLVDAITRLVGIGYGRQQAHDIVLDLIDKLGEPR